MMTKVDYLTLFDEYLIFTTQYAMLYLNESHSAVFNLGEDYHNVHRIKFRSRTQDLAFHVYQATWAGHPAGLIRRYG